MRRVRGARERRVVLLLDVSGSMGSYARTMLRFAHATIIAQRRVEAFTWAPGARVSLDNCRGEIRRGIGARGVSGTRLEGGTRLGECLYQFNESWASEESRAARSSC